MNRKLLILLAIVLLAACQNTRAIPLPLPASDEGAFEITNGLNISHWLSQSDTRGEMRRAYFTREDVRQIAELGYDHLRLPIDEEQMFTETGEKEPEAFELLHNALGWCAEFGLRAVVDLHILRSHYFNAIEKPLFTEEAAQELFYECWRKICGELKGYPNSMVAYELMNEPVADDPEIWNVIANRCAAAIREIEPERTIVIGSNRWQNFGTVKDLRLPAADPNIIISFHYYEPFLLTHYRASWTDVADVPVAVHYPGQLISDEDFASMTPAMQEKYRQYKKVHDAAEIERNFRQVTEVAARYGLRVYCGEYGCIAGAPEADKIRWYKDMCTLFDKYGIARANWDYKGGFGIRSGNRWNTEMIDAIMGK
jgi:endoglucanase